MKEKIFTLFWLDGKTELATGTTIADAITHAGYGGSVVGLLDFWANGDVRASYNWNPVTHDWDKITEPETEKEVTPDLDSDNDPFATTVGELVTRLFNTTSILNTLLAHIKSETDPELFKQLIEHASDDAKSNRKFLISSKVASLVNRGFTLS